MTNTHLLHIDSNGIAHLDPSCEEFHGPELGAIPEGTLDRAPIQCADCD